MHIRHTAQHHEDVSLFCGMRALVFGAEASIIYYCSSTNMFDLPLEQVRWGQGIPLDPHRVVLEAGLDNRNFSQDLPVAPWM
jgi:hypothetical protein